MPTYEYICRNCGIQKEVLQKITEAPLKKCENCFSDTLQRGVGGGIGLSFQGSGFYITDYGSKKESKESNPSTCVHEN